jgi:Zn-dependent protease with chaperone function
VDLPVRGRLVVVSAAIRAGFCWAVAAAAVSAPIYTGVSVRRLLVAAVVFAVTWAVVTLGVFAFPIARYGGWVAKRLTEGDAAPARLANVAAGLALAIGEPEGRVAVVESDVPNVGAFPTRSGNLVVATSGAVDLLGRDELEGLVASQLVVAGDRWVRWATAAQLVQAPRFFLLFGSVFVNPFLMPAAFLAFFGGRYADGARDLAADAAAVGATRHPEPLVRAFRSLVPHARHAHAQRAGLPGFLVDQFWVLSARRTVHTSVSTPGGSRQWTTADEVAAEMRVRADRVERAARGDWSAFEGLGPWRKAMRTLNSSS